MESAEVKEALVKLSFFELPAPRNSPSQIVKLLDSTTIEMRALGVVKGSRDGWKAKKAALVDTQR